MTVEEIKAKEGIQPAVKEILIALLEEIEALKNEGA